MVLLFVSMCEERKRDEGEGLREDGEEETRAPLVELISELGLLISTCTLLGKFK